VPGEYSSSQLWFQARNLATMVTNNASFNCIAAKMLVTARGWPQRQAFLELLRKALSEIPPRRAYYPGAFERYARLTHGRVGIERIGPPSEDTLPWTLILGLEAHDADEPLFRTEPFCAILSGVELDAAGPAAFLDAATEFANARLWGTLSAMLVAPRVLAAEQPEAGLALERAIADLRYGTIALNHWSGLGFAWGSTPWGAFPGGTLAEPRSGLGWVHNAFMLADVEKVIIRGPLVTPMKPQWFADHATADTAGRELVEWLTRPRVSGLSRLVRAALSG
jgi:aldehyde dehydrogenase (NAD(P)+)